VFGYRLGDHNESSVESVEPDGSGSQDGEPERVVPRGVGRRQRVAWVDDHTYDDGVEGSNIFVANIDGTDVRPLLQRSGLGMYEIAWSPDGSRFLMSGCGPPIGTCGLWVIRASDGEATLVVDQARTGEHNVTELDWSPDGKQFLYTSRFKVGRFDYGDATIWRRNADGSGAKNLSLVQPGAATSSYHHNPTWSPDGTRIAFDAGDFRTGHHTVWVMDADGTDVREVTTATSQRRVFRGPAWSPDGRSIAAMGNDPLGTGDVNIPADVWTFALDGSTRRKVTSHTGRWRRSTSAGRHDRRRPSRRPLRRCRR
jgi:Tol biopolymer transport system component